MSATGRQLPKVRLSREEMTRILNLCDAEQVSVEACGRRSARHRSRGLALVVVPVASAGFADGVRVWTRNVSQHGVCFLHPNMLPVDTLVRIELPAGPNGAVVVKEAIVRRCRHIEGMTHEIGVEFQSFARAERE